MNQLQEDGALSRNFQEYPSASAGASITDGQTIHLGMAQKTGTEIRTYGPSGLRKGC